MTFAVAACAECGLKAWPRPAMCRRCGSLRFEEIPAPDGVLEEVAEAQAGIIGTVRTVAGPIVIARVDDAAVGAPVRLALQDGSLVARPA